MSADRKTVLFDTNSLIDYSIPTRPNHKATIRLFDDLMASDQVNSCCFAGSVKDAYYIFQLEQKRDVRNEFGTLTESDALAANELAWGSIENLEKFFTIIPCDMRTVWIARKLKDICSDFEDCLLLAACELADADFLVTSDERLQKIAPTKAAGAETILTLLQPFLD